MRGLPPVLAEQIGYGTCRGGVGGCARGIGRRRLDAVFGAARRLPEGALPFPDRSASAACCRPMQAHRGEPPRPRNGTVSSFV